MSGDDTFDSPLVGGSAQGPSLQEQLKMLPPKRTFRISRPGRDDVHVEAHSLERDGTAVAFVSYDPSYDSTQILAHIHHIFISPEMEVEELMAFQGGSRILS